MLSLLQKQLGKLQNLDLFNCEVTNLDNYREQVFALLDGLVCLDGYDRNNQEADDEDDEVDEEGEGENGGQIDSSSDGEGSLGRCRNRQFIGQ